MTEVWQAEQKEYYKQASVETAALEIMRFAIHRKLYGKTRPDPPFAHTHCIYPKKAQNAMSLMVSEVAKKHPGRSVLEKSRNVAIARRTLSDEELLVILSLSDCSVLHIYKKYQVQATRLHEEANSKRLALHMQLRKKVLELAQELDAVMYMSKKKKDP